MMISSKVIRSAALHEAVIIVAQVTRNQRPPPLQGITYQVIVDTLLHSNLLQPPHIVEYTSVPPLRPLVQPSVLRSKTLSSF